MNILFLGNFEAEHSSENHYKKTFEKLGHDVICQQEGKSHFNFLWDVIINNKIDMFFWVHTHGWQTPGISDFLEAMREHKVPSVAYHLDLYMGIKREIQLHTDPYFKVDHFFTVDKLMADWLNEERKHGHPFAKGHFLPAGVFEDECFIGIADREKYPHDIVFTGSTHYHPEWPYRQQLVNWLRDTYGDRFGHYGPGGLSSIRGKELNNLYESAKVVVGDTLCKDFNYPYYSSDRLFEVTGRGGFLIYPNIPGLRDFFEPEEVQFYNFNDFDQLKHLIDLYLKDSWERDCMREAGFERTKSQHTYTHRLQTLIGTVQLNGSRN